MFLFTEYFSEKKKNMEMKFQSNQSSRWHALKSRPSDFSCKVKVFSLDMVYNRNLEKLFE